jgi:hypothetical protein
LAWGSVAEHLLFKQGETLESNAADRRLQEPLQRSPADVHVSTATEDSTTDTCYININPAIWYNLQTAQLYYTTTMAYRQSQEVDTYSFLRVFIASAIRNMQELQHQNQNKLQKHLNETQNKL